jgi:anti-anti-sigma factor
MNDRPLVVLAPRMLLTGNRDALSGHIRARLDEGFRDLVLSFESTEYVDAAGLAMLVSLHRLVKGTQGARFRTCALRGELRDLFSLTRLDQTLEIVDRVEGVRDAWRAPEEESGQAPLVSALAAT